MVLLALPISVNIDSIDFEIDVEMYNVAVAPCDI